MKPVGVTFGGFVIEFSFENVLIITMVQNVVPTALRSLGDIECTKTSPRWGCDPKRFKSVTQ